MTRTDKTFKFIILFGMVLMLRPMGAAAAPAAKDKDFLAAKREIIVLTVERMRAAPNDSRAIKMGEDRLRRLHEDYKVAKSTPPTVLDNDVQEMKNAAQTVKLQRMRGRPVAAAPEAQPLIDKYWQAYRTGFDELRLGITRDRRLGLTEGRVYWNAMRAYSQLRTRAEENLVGNTPPGLEAWDKIAAKDEWELVKALEGPGKKRRSRGDCVVSPGDHARQVQLNAAEFYQSQWLLPDTHPVGRGGFTVPSGCRTVTQRGDGVKMIFRVSNGGGVVYVGDTEKDFRYGYLAIPPDTPYYFDNPGEAPLDLDYVAIRP